MALARPTIFTSTTKFMLDPSVISGNLHKLYLEPPTYGSNIVTNGDGDNTTDFLVSGATQIADTWAYIVANTVPSIITGTGGFTDRAHRADSVGAGLQASLFTNDFGISNANSKTYTFWMKYRANEGMYVRQLLARPPGASGVNLKLFPANTGNAISVSFEFSPSYSGFVGLWLNSPVVLTGWIEVDEVMIKETTYAH